MDEWARMKEGLTDAGCSPAAIQRAESLYRSGRDEELVRCLRVCRCEALEEIHKKQKQLDRLDGIICRTQQKKRNENGGTHHDEN